MIILNPTAQHELLTGINELADAVATTMGPGGRTIFIEVAGNKTMTKDGVTVAEQSLCSTRVGQIGAELLVESARTSLRKAGDGTTTTTVLARELIVQGLTQISNAHACNVHLMLKHLREYGDKAKAMVLAEGQKIDIDHPLLLEAGKISTNGDTEMAKTILEVIREVGPVPESIVLHEDYNSDTDHVVFQKGLVFESRVNADVLGPFRSRHLISKNKKPVAKVIAFTDPDVELSITIDLNAALEGAVKSDIPVLIIASQVTTDFKRFVANQLKRGIKIAYVTPKLHGTRYQQMLEDVRILTKADSVEMQGDIFLVGSCTSFTILPNSVSIDGPAGYQSAEHKKLIKDVAALRGSSKHETAALKKRLAMLTNGTATIHVGGLTKSDVIERAARYDDCKHSVASALTTGVVRGGGAMYAVISYALAMENINPTQREKRMAREIFMVALSMPMTQISINATGYARDVDLEKLTKNPKLTVDAFTGKQIDAYKVGIVDSVLVQISAIDAAITSASLFLSTGGVIFGKEPLV